MVKCVANENQINRLGGKLRRILLTDHANYVAHLLIESEIFDVLNELLRNVHRIRIPFSELLGMERRQQFVQEFGPISYTVHT
jgi:hypothetical protein